MLGFKSIRYPNNKEMSKGNGKFNPNFFARCYACQAGSLTNAESTYSQDFIENFDKKMTFKSQFEYPEDVRNFRLRTQGRGVVSPNDFLVTFRNNETYTCIIIPKGGIIPNKVSSSAPRGESLEQVIERQK